MRWRAECTLLPVELRVGTREVDELEQAELRCRLRVADRTDAVGVDGHQLTRLDVAHEVRADDVERGGLAGEHPTALSTPEHERAETVRVAHLRRGCASLHEHERECTRELRQHILQCALRPRSSERPSSS
jgi:hypothetical protein